NACDREATSGRAELPACGEAVEVTFLVLRDHLRALERLAEAEGITVGRLLRRTIRDHLARERGRGLDTKQHPPGNRFTGLTQAQAGTNDRGAMKPPNEEGG